MIPKSKLRRPALALLAWAALAAQASIAQAFNAESATALIEKHADAIVEVRLVNEVRVRLIEGPEGIAEMIEQGTAEEKEFNAKGVMIDPNGVVAVPSLPLNPTVMLGEISVSTPVGDIKLALESRLSNVRIITSAGTEIEADVVLADGETGLMLVKARSKPESGMPALTLAPARPQPPAFTPVLCLSRMSAAFGHQPTATIVHATGPLASRQGLDPLADAGASSLGGAVFDADGGFLGITVIPTGDRSSNASLLDVRIYLIPASTLLRLVKEHLN